MTSVASGSSIGRDPKDYEIHWLIDYGTSYLSVGAQIIRKGSTPKPHLTHVLTLQESYPSGEIPQIVGFVRRQSRLPFDEADFKWGYELTEILNDPQNRLTGKQVCVFERLKILLHPTPKTTEARTTIEQTLTEAKIQGATTNWLVEKHLHCIRKAALRATVRAYGPRSSWSEDEILAMDVHTFFTVPEISSHDSTRRLQQRLAAAGFQRSVALTETEAAGAWRSYQLLEQSRKTAQFPRQLRREDEILVADAGGLTLNVSSYRCEGFVKYGAGIVIHPTGRNEGGTCGSELITFKCFEYVRRQLCPNGGFEAYLESLGYSKEAFYREIARAFESYKINFTDEPPSRWIIINSRRERSSQGGFGQNGPARVEITKAQVAFWFTEAIEEITRRIERVRRESTKTIILTGGFFRSMHLMKALRKQYEPLDIWMPDMKVEGNRSDLSVVHGGMARSVLMTPKPPQGLCMGVAQCEEYDSEIHTDIPESSKTLIKECIYTGFRCVEDRWCALLGPEDLVDGNGPFTAEPIWQEYLLAKDEPFLSKQVYVTTSQIKNGDSMVSRSRGHRHTRKDLEEWGDEIKHSIDQHTLERYEKLWPSGLGKRKPEDVRYRVWARLIVVRTGPNGMYDVDLNWEIAPPDFRGYSGKNQIFKPIEEGPFESVGIDKLHDGKHPSFIQRNGIPPKTLDPIGRAVPSVEGRSRSTPDSDLSTEVHYVSARILGDDDRDVDYNPNTVNKTKKRKATGRAQLVQERIKRIHMRNST